ncbi:hypothetical protein B0H12DRAFT_1079180 [Mycena haematopus]|nr:hypothetical protein B0H12DRAFT_1079180 [Mycena haematopus]
MDVASVNSFEGWSECWSECGFDPTFLSALVGDLGLTTPKWNWSAGIGVFTIAALKAYTFHKGAHRERGSTSTNSAVASGAAREGAANYWILKFGASSRTPSTTVLTGSGSTRRRRATVALGAAEAARAVAGCGQANSGVVSQKQKQKASFVYGPMVGGVMRSTGRCGGERKQNHTGINRISAHSKIDLI